jgi:hypothetical protein
MRCVYLFSPLAFTGSERNDRLGPVALASGAADIIEEALHCLAGIWMG